MSSGDFKWKEYSIGFTVEIDPFKEKNCILYHRNNKPFIRKYKKEISTGRTYDDVLHEFFQLKIAWHKEQMHNTMRECLFNG